MTSLQRLALALGLLTAVATCVALADEKDLEGTSLDEPGTAKTAAARGAKTSAPGGTMTIELVGPDGNSIEDMRFVRQIPGHMAVREFPHVFSLEGKALFTAGNAIVTVDGKEVKATIEKGTISFDVSIAQKDGCHDYRVAFASSPRGQPAE